MIQIPSQKASEKQIARPKTRKSFRMILPDSEFSSKLSSRFNQVRGKTRLIQNFDERFSRSLDIEPGEHGLRSARLGSSIGRGNKTVLQLDKWPIFL